MKLLHGIQELLVAGPCHGEFSLGSGLPYKGGRER